MQTVWKTGLKNQLTDQILYYSTEADKGRLKNYEIGIFNFIHGRETDLISIEKIEARTTSSNLERGKYYVNQGYIKNLDIINDKFIQSIVSGSFIYKVFVEFQENDLNVFCTCPYNSKGYCKHAVATILLLMDSEKMQPNRITVPAWQEIIYKFSFRFQKNFYRTFKQKSFKQP